MTAVSEVHHFGLLGDDNGAVSAAFVPELGITLLTASVPSDKRRASIQVKIQGVQQLKDLVEKIERIDKDYRRRKANLERPVKVAGGELFTVMSMPNHFDARFELGGEAPDRRRQWFKASQAVRSTLSKS